MPEFFTDHGHFLLLPDRHPDECLTGSSDVASAKPDSHYLSLPTKQTNKNLTWWTVSPSYQVLMAEIWGHPGFFPWPQTPSLSRSCCRNRGFYNRFHHSPSHCVPATSRSRRPPSSVTRSWQQLPDSLLTSIPAPWLPQSSWRFLVKTGLCRLLPVSLTLRIKSPLPATGPRGPPPHCPGSLFTLSVQPLPYPVTHGHCPLLSSSLQFAPSCVTPSAQDVPPRTSLTTCPRSGSLPSASLISGGSSVSSLWGAHSHCPLALLHP